MAAFHRILLLTSVALLSGAASSSQRTRRGIAELAGTVQCSTGLFAVDYTMYGCYCGLGGQGWPRDEADWCCFRHDCCYGEVERQDCQIRTDPYHWTCKNHIPECDDLEGTCEKMLCICDKEVADCLGRAPYSLWYAAWPTVFCQGGGPSCEENSQTEEDP